MQKVYKNLIDVQGSKKEEGTRLSGTGNRDMKACWSLWYPVFAVFWTIDPRTYCLVAWAELLRA